MIMNTFIGTSYELHLASQLTMEGVIVSMPLVDIGVDLIATNQNFSKCTPIQVKFKSQEKNIFLNKKEAASISEKRAYLAYYLKGAAYYLPYEIFNKLSLKASRRKDEPTFITVHDNTAELSEFKDGLGFKKLIEQIKSV
jgi:hypothetical protein